MKSMRILVADDEPGIRLLLHDALIRYGHEVACVENGTEAVEFVLNNQVDAVFMDIRMPKGDGVWALKEIRKTHADLPVVMITGCSQREFIDETMEHGSLACLIKPFSIRDIIGMLEWIDISGNEKAA